MNDSPAGVEQATTPKPSERMAQLVDELADAMYACGEWTKDDDDPYEPLSIRARQAHEALDRVIAELEQQQRDAISALLANRPLRECVANALAILMHVVHVAEPTIKADADGC